MAKESMAFLQGESGGNESWLHPSTWSGRRWLGIVGVGLLVAALW